MTKKLLARKGVFFLLLFTVSCGNTDSAGTYLHGNSDTIRASFTDTEKKTDDQIINDTVWVCKSQGAKKYHIDRDCGGLKRCKHTIEKRCRKDAEAIGLTQCSKKKCHS